MTYKEIRKTEIDACLLPGYDEPAIKAAWREACLAVREGRITDEQQEEIYDILF